MSDSRSETVNKKQCGPSTAVLEPDETFMTDKGSTAVADMAIATTSNSKGTMNIFAESIMRIDPVALELEPDPIPSEWILEGAPQARVTKLLTSRDWTSTVVVWDCTPGSFEWHYTKDETIFFISGEAFMMDDENLEHRFGAGDIAFLTAGTSCRWRVTQPIRKIAVVRETIWRPLGFLLKISKKLLRREHAELKSGNWASNLVNRNLPGHA